MNVFMFGILVAMIPMIPAVIFFMRARDNAPQQATQRLMAGLKAFNVVIGLMAVGLGIVWLATPSSVSAAVLGETAATTSDPYAALGAAISTGLAAIGAGMAVSGTGSAAVSAIAEKPESFGRALIFVGLAEGIAIYGLIISFMILNR